VRIFIEGEIDFRAAGDSGGFDAADVTGDLRAGRGDIFRCRPSSGSSVRTLNLVFSGVFFGAEIFFEAHQECGAGGLPRRPRLGGFVGDDRRRAERQVAAAVAPEMRMTGRLAIGSAAAAVLGPMPSGLRLKPELRARWLR